MSKVKVNYSNNYKAIQNRLKKLPELEKGVVKAKLKKDASDVVKEFKAGIKNDSFELDRLQPKTVIQKRGYRKPDNPLYGKGGNDPRSYKNMLIIREVKNGYTVRPSTRMHHKAKLTLKHLFMIHEFGATFKGRNGAIIRILARPALQRAFNRVMGKRNSKENAMQMKLAILSYINKGDVKYFDIITDKFNKDIERIIT